MTFGHKFRKEQFPIADSGFTSVNHGSFGMVPQMVLNKMTETTKLFYSSPDSYIFTQHDDVLKEARKAIGKVLDCPAQNLTFVPGDTFAVNTVLRSFPFAKGDKVVIANTTYLACNKTFEFLTDYIGIEVIVLDFDLPVTHEEILERFEATFESNNVKMAFFDTVSSTPSIRYPFRELVRLCKKSNVLSFVDGAHGIGLLPIEFEKMDFKPDFFCSNLHKWYSLPYSFTVLYVAPQHQASVQTFPITASYVKPENAVVTESFFYEKFSPQSWQYYMNILLITTAVEFRNEICGGEAEIFDYCLSLAQKIKEMTRKTWPGSKPIENANGDLDSAMISIFVPAEISTALKALDQAEKAKFLEQIRVTLIKKHKTFVPLFLFKDRLAFRLSAQVYNELSDYEYAVKSVKSAIEEYFEFADVLPDLIDLKI